MAVNELIPPFDGDRRPSAASKACGANIGGGQSSLKRDSFSSHPCTDLAALSLPCAAAAAGVSIAIGSIC
jgi:hypothetical protein